MATASNRSSTLGRALGALGLLAALARAGEPFAETTPGKPGGAGVVPSLSGSGAGTPGSPNELLLKRAAKDSTASLVIGLSELAAPFKGGVLGPAVDALVAGLPIDGDGRLAVPFALPLDAPPGLVVWTQCWIVDPGASAGLSASNSLAFTVQAVAEPLYDAAAPLVVATADGPAGALSGDFDEDGVPDLLVAAIGPSAHLLLRGLGDGTFDETVLTYVTDLGSPCLAADLDGDGHLDLCGVAAGAVGVRLGQGDGSFGALDSFAGGSLMVDLVSADVDGDGVLDVVSADAAGTVTVLLGRGGGDLYPGVSHVVGFNPTHVAAGDLDGDGLVDLAVTYGGGTGRVAVLFNAGEGAFAQPLVLPVGALPEALVIADLDDDGHADLAVCALASADVRVLLGQGGGAFAPASTTPMPPGTQPKQMRCADLDGDGTLDLLVSRFGGLSLFRGMGEGGLCPEEFYPVANSYHGSLALDDLDGDGLLDVVTTRLTLDEVLVLLHL